MRLALKYCATAILGFSSLAAPGCAPESQAGGFSCPAIARDCRQDRLPKTQGSKVIDCGTVSCPAGFKGKYSRDWTKMQELIHQESSGGDGYQSRSNAFQVAKLSGLVPRWGQDSTTTASSYGATGGLVTFFDAVTNQEVATLSGMIIEHFPPPPHRAK
jgi:hypothetical protein